MLHHAKGLENEPPEVIAVDWPLLWVCLGLVLAGLAAYVMLLY